MTAQSDPSISSVALRGRSATIWLEGGAILLDQDGIRRRIPLEAVEEIRVEEAPQRSVEVVLTAAKGTVGTTYRLECRSSATVTAFADAVNRALPRRDSGEPQRDGAELVEVLPKESRVRPGDPRWQIGGLIFLGLYLAGLVTLILAGEFYQPIMWCVGLAPLFLAGILFSMVFEALYDRWILRRRGITVVATYYDYVGSRERPIFRFIDAEGNERKVRLDYKAKAITTTPKRVKVTYDPHHPKRAVATLPATTWVLRTIGVILFGVPLLLLALFLVPYQLIELLFN